MMQSSKWYSIAARMLILLAAARIGALNELVPDSLIARAADRMSGASDALIIAMCAASVIGWFDIITHDLFGKHVTFGIPTKLLHQLCIAYYGAMAGGFGVLGFIASDIGLHGGWIVTLMYSGLCVASLMIAAGIASERRA